MGGYNDELKKAGRDVAQARLRVMGMHSSARTRLVGKVPFAIITMS